MLLCCAPTLSQMCPTMLQLREGVLVKNVCKWRLSTFLFGTNSSEVHMTDMNDIKQELLLTVCSSTSCHAQMFFFFSVSATRGSSGTADSEQRRVRTKLRRFLQRRPTLQSVKEKGYIRGELSVRLSDAHTESYSQTQDAMFLYPSPVQITCSAVTWTHCVTEKTTPSPSLLRSASEQWRGEVNTTHTHLIHTNTNSRLTAECVFRSGRGRDLQSERKLGRDPETTTQSWSW